jgi:hypothetical protein
MKLIGTIKSIVKEDKENSIPNMIKTLGISDAIKYFGNYYTIEPYLKEIDKVNFIEEKVAGLSELLGNSITLVEPIHYGENDEELKQIEYLRKEWVVVEVYDTAMNRHIGNFRLKYESLPGQILDELVKILLNH